MNNTLKKSTTVVILIMMSLGRMSWSQEQNDTNQGNSIKIEHYIRKIKTDTLYFAGDALNNSFFKIKFPDSLFNAAKVTVKKYIIDGIRGVHGTLFSKEKTFYKVRYQVKGHRRAEKFLEKILETLDLTKKELEEAEYIEIHGKEVVFNYDTSKRFHYFVFRLPDTSQEIQIK